MGKPESENEYFDGVIGGRVMPEDRKITCPGCLSLIENQRKRILNDRIKENEIIQAFCNEVDRRAHELMMRDNRVSGKHYAAMRLILKEKYGVDWGR